MDETQLWATLILLAIFATTALLGWYASWLHRRSRLKIHDLHEETKGVRIRLERAAEEASDERRQIRADNKGFQARLWAQFVEWLQYMRGR